MRVIKYSVVTLCALLLWGYSVGPAPERPAPQASVASPAVDEDTRLASRDEPAAPLLTPVTLTVPMTRPAAETVNPASLPVTDAPGTDETRPAATDEAVAAALDAAQALPEADPPASGATVTAAVAPEAEAPRATVIADKLNLRSGPGREFAALASLRRGTEVEITGEAAEGWIGVSFDGEDGFVAEEFIEMAEPG